MQFVLYILVTLSQRVCGSYESPCHNECVFAQFILFIGHIVIMSGCVCAVHALDICHIVTMASVYFVFITIRHIFIMSVLPFSAILFRRSRLYWGGFGFCSPLSVT